MKTKQTLKRINLCKKPCTEMCRNCKSFIGCISFAKFLEKHGNPAKYAHFDFRTSLKNQKTREYVLNPENVAHHGFFPFINFTKKQTKYDASLPDHIKYKERELYYAAHRDRCIYQYYSFLMNEAYNKFSYENNLDDVAIAYRTNSERSNIHCAKLAFDFLKKTEKALIIINDFTGFFDNLNHRYLKEKVAQLIGQEELSPDFAAVMKNITKFSWLSWEEVVTADGKTLEYPRLKTTMNEKDKILERYQFRKFQKYIHKNPNNFGIPQGSPISAVLANVYMMDFDTDMNQMVKSHNGIYMRYSDDTIVIIPYKKSTEVKELISRYNNILSLYSEYVKVQPTKTEIATYENGKIFERTNLKQHIDYLGFRFKNGKVMVRPRSITRYHYRLKRKAKGIYNIVGVTHIAYTDIYKQFSDCGIDENGYGNFVNYLKKADRILNLKDDPAAMKIIRYHKMYVRRAINKNATIIHPSLDEIPLLKEKEKAKAEIKARIRDKFSQEMQLTKLSA